MAGTVAVITGGQYGSEGKGACAAALAAAEGRALAAVRVAGPNAGHTVQGPGPTGPNHDWRLRSVPVAAVADPDAKLVIAAGSEVDLAVLAEEVAALDDAGYFVSERLYIDQQATILEPHHTELESTVELQKRIGSTQKGIGSARSHRILRSAKIAKELDGGDLDAYEGLKNVNQFQICDTVQLLREHLDIAGAVHIEGTQGYGLGLHAGSYPYCTSSDCRAIDFMAMAGLSPWANYVSDYTVWVVLRTYPIRVAGNSGPLYEETTFEEIGQPTEYTTVTKKPRRVGAWDADLARAAVEANGPFDGMRIWLSFFDYWVPKTAGVNANGSINTREKVEVLDDEAWHWVDMVQRDIGRKVDVLGTGPRTMVTL